MLPKGQYDLGEMPRFGMTQYAPRFPTELGAPNITLAGDLVRPGSYAAEFAALPRTELRADFHCVTTWSCRGLTWEGVLFRDFYEKLVLPIARPKLEARFVILRGQDGYRASLPLDYLLAENVILAERLNGAPLSVANGAPLRLVAPDHYGYKSVKHLARVEFLTARVEYHPITRRFIEHPLARVAREERGRYFPGFILRHFYRRAVAPTRKLFQDALDRYLAQKG